MKTKVIFRKWKTKPYGVIAIFPEIPHDSRGWNCSSYEHTGQHGSCDPFVISRTSPAEPEEFASLKRELESASCGYDLEIVKRFPANAYDVRRKALEQARA